MPSMDAFQSGLFWSVYRDTEQVFLDFLEYVPLVSEHNRVYSRKFLELILQIGGYVDTAFKEMATYSKFDGNTKIEEIRQKTTQEKTVKISLVRETFEPIYTLSSKKIVVKKPKLFLQAYGTLIPFSEFARNKSPQWWKVYTALKHNWSKNIKKANLKNTLEALAGLFLLNVVHEPSIFRLADMGILLTLNPRGQRFHFAPPLLRKILLKEHPLGSDRIIVDTPLFRWNFE